MSRPWTDRDGNRLPLDANGAIQIEELAPSTSTPTFGRNVTTTSYDPGVLNGWHKRGYNLEYSVAAQHQLADRVSVNGGYYRREFGNQTFTDDLRYDANSYNYFCMNAPADPDLPGGGGYQVCGIPDLKPEVFALNQPANSLIRFSDDFGGETNMYQGFDVNLEGRFRNGAFLKGGIAATIAHLRPVQSARSWSGSHNGGVDIPWDRGLRRRLQLLPPRVPVSTRCETLRQLSVAVGYHAGRHVPVQPRCSDWWRWPEHSGQLHPEQRAGHSDQGAVRGPAWHHEPSR